MLPDLHIVSEITDNATQIAVFVILLTSLVLLSFVIYRLGWFDEHLPAFSTKVPMTAIQRVHNPFVLSVTELKQATLESGVAVQITSQVPCYIRVYWGMLIKDVYPLIHQEWSLFQQSLQEDVFKDYSLYSEEIVEIEPIEEKHFMLRPPSTEFITEIGDPPRERYPLVIILCDISVVDEPFNEVWTTQVISYASIFHIKDAVCTGDSQVIAQYVRTAFGKPCSLQQLYVTDSTLDGSTSYDGSQSADEDDGSHPETSGQCVVCLSEAVTRAFLPCRHACVCDSCFHRLSHCPMCRMIISSSFHIHETQ